MAVFVVDASVALAWCFEDEATTWSEEFLEPYGRVIESSFLCTGPPKWQTRS